MSELQRPVTVLIAALGGEGGGVLTNWIVNAAADLGLPAQSTSIPGVAQRTGATTYYIEIFPKTWRELGDARPVMALTPGIGDIDVMVASEFLEAGRAISSGFVTPDRTLLIASTSRFYAINEKMAMGDGRYDQTRLFDAAQNNSQDRILFDMDEAAKKSGAMINAVMLGAIAGSGRLPVPVEAFETAIRNDGKSVDNNLRGFRAGLAAARETSAARGTSPDGKRHQTASKASDPLEDNIRAQMPQLAQDVMIEGVRRLTRFQNAAYARLYLDRLAPVLAADQRAASGGKLLREVARHLAVRMSFEDLIRVAEAKIEPARMTRIIAELNAKPDEPFHVVEFLKPGIEEMCQILPPRLARWILKISAQRGWLDRVHVGMEVKTTSISGYLRFWLLAKLKHWRPHSFRYHEEQAAITSWLSLILDAAPKSPALAIEIAECARLIKGYGSTHERGHSNFQMIETRVRRPAIVGRLPVDRAIDAIASARTAALVDPDGDGLARCLGDLDTLMAMRVAAE
jgi:indolepyruvate ferredoxin oxidoreductase beta subunit